MKRIGTFEWLLSHRNFDGDTCLLWPFSRDTKGYGQVSAGNGTNPKKANRVMCQIVHGDPPSPLHQAAHSCGNRSCVNPRHLSWKTQAENEDDKKQHGTLVPNTWGKRGKLTSQQRREIQEAKGRVSAPDLAAKYGVRRGTIEYWQRRERA